MRAAGVEKLMLVVERLLHAVANLIPGTLILRLFLTPYDFFRVAVAREHTSILFDRKRIQLLHAYDRDPFEMFVASKFREIEIHFTAAEHDAPNRVLGDLLGLLDQRLEAAAR